MMSHWQKLQAQQAMGQVAVARTLAACDRIRRDASSGGYLCTELIREIRVRQDALRAAGVRE